jgi:hypothetical protein
LAGLFRKRFPIENGPVAQERADYFSEVLTDLNTVLRLLPKPFTAAIISKCDARRVS